MKKNKQAEILKAIIKKAENSSPEELEEALSFLEAVDKVKEEIAKSIFDDIEDKIFTPFGNPSFHAINIKLYEDLKSKWIK